MQNSERSAGILRIDHTSVTSIPACFRARRSDLGAPRSVMTSCSDRWRRDQRQAAASELAGVANGNRLLRDLDHHAIHFGFQQIRSAQAEVNVESVHSEK